MPDGVRFEAWVGGDESSEFLRQSRLVAERWAAAGARTRFEILPGANHFTAPAGWPIPQARWSRPCVRLAAATKSLTPRPPFHRFRANSERLAQR